MLKCPGCGQTKHFSISCTVVKTFEFDSKGATARSYVSGDADWDSESVVRCDNEECEYTAPAGWFMKHA